MPKPSGAVLINTLSANLVQAIRRKPRFEQAANCAHPRYDGIEISHRNTKRPVQLHRASALFRSLPRITSLAATEARRRRGVLWSDRR